MAPLRYLVCGPYGSGNLGDDAIALEVVDQIELRSGIVSIAGIDSYRFEQSTGRQIAFVPRLNLRAGEFSMIRTLGKSDVVVIGGGEQFSEPRVANPLWGHLATNFQLYLLAKFFRKKFAAVGVGVSDGLSLFGRFALRRIALGADFFSVRDEASFLRLKALAPTANIHLCADPAFLESRVNKDEARQNLCRQFSIDHSAKIVVVMPSKDKFHSMAYIERLNASVEQLNRLGIEVLYAVSDSQQGYDTEIFNQGLLSTSRMARWAAPGSLSLAQLVEMIAAADCLVSSRMHPLIFAACQSTPFVCLSRAGKMEALMRILGDQKYLRLDFSPEQLVEAVQLKCSSNSVEDGEVHVERARKKALEQFEILFDDSGK